jgi:hypothetical protein
MNEDEPQRLASIVSAIAFCGFALLAALTAPFWWSPMQGWLGPLKTWLPVAPSQRGTQAPQAPAWTDKEVEAALMQCVQALAPVIADAAPLAPIRTGDCGAPAPVLVKSIGDTDKVLFDPPLVLDCPMVAALERWLRESVQPAAKEALSSPVSRIIGSSYACRNVYNLQNGHLSQHAFANAIDVPMFVLADGRKIDVTHGWGPTQRDLAGAKVKKELVSITGSVAEKKPEENEKAEAKTKGARTEVVKVSAAPEPSDASGKAADPVFVAEAKFLRLAHDGGCKVFSTVLGPEANDVHRTHLHLDLQDRKASVCE